MPREKIGRSYCKKFSSSSTQQYALKRKVSNRTGNDSAPTSIKKEDCSTNRLLKPGIAVTVNDKESRKLPAQLQALKSNAPATAIGGKNQDLSVQMPMYKSTAPCLTTKMLDEESSSSSSCDSSSSEEPVVSSSLVSLHTKVSEIHQRVTRVYIKTREMNNSVLSLKREVDTLVSEIVQMKDQLLTFWPANTDEELQTIVQNITDYKAIARRVEHNNIRQTVRTFIKVFMKENLAIQYSWTGFGVSRKYTRKSFRDSAIFTVLTKALKYTRHRFVMQRTLAAAVAAVLSQAGAWGNEQRKGKIAPEEEEESESESSSEESVDV